MNTLAEWYPGDSSLIATLEVFFIIGMLVTLTWVAAASVARRHAAWRSALWLTALAGVVLAPALVLSGRQLPWYYSVLPAQLAAAQGPMTPAASAPAHSTGATDALLPGAGGRPAARSASESLVAIPSRDSSVAVPPQHKAVQTKSTPPLSQIAPEAAELVHAQPAPVPDSRHALVTLGFVVWGLGSLYLLARLVHGWWRVQGLWRRLRPLNAEPMQEELTAVARALTVRRLPEVAISPAVRSPLVVGLISPRVVLPDTLPERLSPHQLREVLVHECAHIVRGDPWLHLLQRLISIVFWVHPLVHLLNRQLDKAREEVCDNYVLTSTEAPSYAETLLAVAKLCYPTPRLEGYLTMMPRHGKLEQRVVDLLDERRDTTTHLSVPQRLAASLSLFLLLGAASSVGLHGAAHPKDEQATTQAGGPPPAANQPTQPASPKAGIPLKGTVLADDGTPAAGANIWAAQFTYGPLQRQETVTDAKGRYTLALSPGKWWVWARRGTQGGEGQEPHNTVQIVTGRVPEPITIRMEERGKLRGRLFEAETGKSIAGGHIFLDVGLVLVTGADGRFEVGGLTRRSHESFVVAPGRMRMRVLFDTTAKADTELDIPLPRGSKIVGRVTDVDGKPIRGAQVGRHTSGSFFSINALFQACDADGRFDYDDAVPGDQPTRLTASAPGFVDDELNGVATLPDGKPLELNFRLRRKPSDKPDPQAPAEDRQRIVSGRVRGPDDKSVPDVLVRWGYQPHSDAIQTRTDGEGRFRFTVPDKLNVLAILPSGHLPEFPDVPAGGDRTVEVALRKGNIVRGRVLDESGKPVKRVHVIAVVGSPDPRIGNPYWLTEAAAFTDAEGKFALRGIPDGARFDFLKQGLSDLRNQELTLDGAENAVAVTMSYGGAIRGRVVDREGKPIRDFRVLVNQPRDQRPGDVSGGYFAGFCGTGVRFSSNDGSFVLTGIGAGSVLRLTALADGHGEATVDRVSSVPLNHLEKTEPVTLRAGPPVAFRVRAVAAGGRPIPGARITLVNGDLGLDQTFSWGYHNASWEDMARQRTRSDGWANFPALSFAGATVLVQAPGYARHRIGWRGGEKELTVELAPEAVITGIVHDAAGNPIRDFYVNLQFGGDNISASAGADDGGRFRVAELPAGVWALTIRGGDGQSQLHQSQVSIRAGDIKELKLEAQEPKSVPKKE